MFNLIKELVPLLNWEQRKKFMQLQVFVVLMSLAEVFGVASIGPFIALAGDPNILTTNKKLASLYAWSSLGSSQNFIFYAGIAVIVTLAIGTVLSVLTTWRLSLFGSSIGYEIGDELYNYYLHQPWPFHASGNSAQLTKQIAAETNRVTSNIIIPLMQMNSSIIMCFIMLTALFLYEPTVALVGMTLFALVYILLFKTIRKKLANNGKAISQLTGNRFKLMNEGFGGVKDILLFGRQDTFIRQFKESSKKISYAQATNKSFSNIPRYVLELLAFGSIIFFITFLLKKENSSLNDIMPMLSVYAVAGLKILPAFQQIYATMAGVKSNQAAFNSIRKDLLAAKKKRTVINNSDEKLQLCEKLELKNINFIYEGSEKKILEGLHLTIHKNQTVGFVGPSGSGKSTTIDLILGLIHPTEGEMLVDGVSINESNQREWQNNIGFVPQSIFLADATISENIAFGLPSEKIVEDRIMEVLRLSHLDEFVLSLKDGIHTRVGERGVQLSGGQRQRIGIARALYNDADLLVFDEATSALDGITEKLIMDAISDFTGKKTILIVAHRLSTVKHCDVIYFMDRGQVIDSGSYEELVSKNKKFREMTMISI